MNKLLFALMLVASSAFAGCGDQFYVRSTQIVVPNTTEYCSSFFVVAYSAQLKSPIVVFEGIKGTTAKVIRKDAFRPDERIAKGQRAELGDFLNSGFDKGHMAPAADASTPEEMNDTFRLSNMTFQNKHLNETPWRLMEMHVRLKSSTVPNQLGITHIATGAIYGKETMGANKVGFPTGYYKIVWYPSGQTEAFYGENTSVATVDPVTIDWVNSKSGLSFPTK